ncbi:MAG: 30S ribosome-binding factor RbfA [Desulfosalsimonadaceae bacterium]
MKPYTRAERVGGLIQSALFDILLKSIKDPRLDPVTITGVKMTKDLKLARVYFASSDDPKDAAAGFKKAHGFIKKALAKELDLRYMPELQFLYDESIDYAVHMTTVLEQMKKENGTDPGSTDKE